MPLVIPAPLFGTIGAPEICGAGKGLSVVDTNAQAAAERILAAAFRKPVRLAGRPDKLTGSERCKVFRWRVHDPPEGVPAHVVIKQAAVRKGQRYDPASPTGPAATTLNEWAGLQFLNHAFANSPCGPIPRFYGGDRSAGLVVLEDLGIGRRLDEYLLGDDPAEAEQALTSLFRAVGAMHAVSFGRKTEYEQIRNSLGPVRRRDVNGRAAETVEKAGAVCALLNVTPAPGFREELALVARSAWEPATFVAYKHRDICEDNCLQTGDGWKLFDFESGEFGNTLWDGLCPRLLFPTGWCVGRIPANVLARVEAAYREELSKSCPQAGEDALFFRAVADTCAYWAMATLIGSLPAALQSDAPSALAPAGKHASATKRRCVLARLDVAAETTAQFGHREVVGATAHDLAKRLRRLWPSEVHELPCYPAFVPAAGAFGRVPR